MAAYSNFRSSSQIEIEQEELREARKTVLEKAKEDYEKSERRRERARQAGEGTWMLSSVTKRIDKEQKAMEKVKEKKKKKDKKKKKKHKKEKKRKRQSSSSDSESSEEEAAWVVKGSKRGKVGPVSGPILQRDSWMESPLVGDLIPTVTRAELRERERGEEERKKAEAARLLEQPGQHSRELNPYWKGGGAGLPENRTSSAPATTGTAGDRGLSWLRKAYQRCQQQAKDEGRSLEDVAADRYGSLDKLNAMIQEAEEASGFGGWRGRHGNQRSQGGKDDIPRSSSLSSSSSSAAAKPKRRFARPNDSDDGDKKDLADYRGRSEALREGRRDGGRSSGGGGAGWRKKPAASSQAGKEEMGGGGGRVHGGGGRRRHKQSPSSASSRGSSSSSGSSESSGEDEGRGRGGGGKKAEAPTTTKMPTTSTAVVKMLSEDEMNSLGARILRAELMGEEDLARQLKAQLEQAQKAREGAQTARSEVAPKTPGARGEGKTEEGDDDDDGVVVLTRTGRDGMVRPLLDQEFDRDRGGKKRRSKMKNVATHSREGERTQYFDDDDRHDLKSLVQREKLGTAEDQNAMFARLAGRSAEKTDDDFQVDDIFLSKAARQQSGAGNEEKERSRAMFEHRKVSSAMDKCQFCFSKIPKHLLIAIGTKVYLSLPAHRSLTPGHCLVIPMQHVSSATALDEDVWTEIQMFRKQLVQMFVSQEQDVVFMETSMHLRHFPHMVLECVPLEREIGDLAPIYFKKAIQDAGPEWSNNKKVVDLSRKDIRHSVPKGFSYFSVDFGLQGGFAHVIEDEKTFPSYFGREIVGGMIDAEPGLWRKPHREGFEDQRRKVVEFEKWWKPFDFTSSV